MSNIKTIRLPYSTMEVCTICGESGDYVWRCKDISIRDKPRVRIGQVVQLGHAGHARHCPSPEGIWVVNGLFYSQPVHCIGGVYHQEQPRHHQLCVRLKRMDSEGYAVFTHAEFMRHWEEGASQVVQRVEPKRYEPTAKRGFWWKLFRWPWDLDER